MAARTAPSPLASGGRRRPGSAPLPDGVRGAAPLLRLQRAAGNRAVATLARAPTTSTSPPAAAPALTPTGVKPVGDGISTHGAIDRFARKAIWFYQSHRDADLASYGHYLVAAVSTELAAVGCPGVQAITGSGLMGALGEFEADNWAIVINVDRLRGLNGATTVGELDPGDAAFFASVVYHEGRHAEQRFRASRLMAAGHEDDPLEEAEPDIVTAARKLALDRRTPARERTEAADWRDFMVGEDETYVSAVDSWRKTWWRPPCSPATSPVTTPPTPAVRSRGCWRGGRGSTGPAATSALTWPAPSSAPAAR